MGIPCTLKKIFFNLKVSTILIVKYPKYPHWSQKQAKMPNITAQKVPDSAKNKTQKSKRKESNLIIYE